MPRSNFCYLLLLSQGIFRKRLLRKDEITTMNVNEDEKKLFFFKSKMMKNENKRPNHGPYPFACGA